jgi:PAS domain S-box-containing protein
MSADLNSERVLVLTPFGRDGVVATSLLSQAGYDAQSCADLGDLIRGITAGAGCAVLAEEVLADGPGLGPLTTWLADQPAWSDLPFIVLTRHGGGPERSQTARRVVEALGNVTLLERPFHSATLISVVAAGIRSRRRQYDARRLLDEIQAGAVALRESEDHYRHAVELNPQVSWTARPDGCLDRVAQRWHDWTGTTGLGSTWGDAVHPDDLGPSVDAWSRSWRTGVPYEIEHRIRMRSGQYRWMRSRAYPRRGPDGAIVAWYGTTEDVDEEKQADDRQQLLIRELHHRVKNTLSTVQAVMSSTARTSATIEQFQEAFAARLASLARTHSLLTTDIRQRVGFRHLLEAELEPYTDGERVHLSGPDIDLPSDIAVPLGMAIHELTTNAVKYGALSSRSGRLLITWTREPSSEAVMGWTWREQGGPPVAPPRHEGFGTKLLQRVLRQQIGADLRFDFLPTGLEVVGDIPLVLEET